jgi:hypothetical protein
MVTRPRPRRCSSSASSSSRPRTPGRSLALSLGNSTSELNRTLTRFSLSSTRAAPRRSLVGTAMSRTGATMSRIGAPPGDGVGSLLAAVGMPSSTIAPSPAATARPLLDGDTRDRAEMRERDIQRSDLSRRSRVGRIERVCVTWLQVAGQMVATHALTFAVAGCEIGLAADVHAAPDSRPEPLGSSHGDSFMGRAGLQVSELLSPSTSGPMIMQSS